MSSAKIAITIDREVLKRLDEWTRERQFSSRSRAIQEAIEEKLEHASKGRLARECAKLDVDFE